MLFLPQHVGTLLIGGAAVVLAQVQALRPVLLSTRAWLLAVARAVAQAPEVGGVALGPGSILRVANWESEG